MVGIRGTKSREIECVIFDFGNVIATFDHGLATRALAGLAGDEWDADKIHDEIFKPKGLENQYDCGELTTSQFIGELKNRFGIRATDEAIRTAWANIFRRNQSVIDLIPKLRTMCYRLVLASNTNEIHHDWFSSRYPVLHEFHSKVFSFRAKCRKPDPKFFGVCLKKAGCPPQNCVYVDDLEENVKVAAGLGMKTILFTSTEHLISELTAFGIPNLDQPRTLSLEEVEAKTTVYREKYATFRHLDGLRWKVPASVFAVAAIGAGFSREHPNFPWTVALLLFGVLALLSKRLMRRIRLNVDLNTKALSRFGFPLGDYSIPEPQGKIGAAFGFEVLMLIIAVASIAGGLYRALILGSL